MQSKKLSEEPFRIHINSNAFWDDVFILSFFLNPWLTDIKLSHFLGEAGAQKFIATLFVFVFILGGVKSLVLEKNKGLKSSN